MGLPENHMIEYCHLPDSQICPVAGDKPPRYAGFRSTGRPADAACPLYYSLLKSPRAATNFLSCQFRERFC